VVGLLVTLAAFAVALVAALLVGRSRGRAALEAARAQAGARLAQARDEVEALRRRGDERTRVEAARLAQALTERVKGERAELRDYEGELDEREGLLASREQGLAEREVQVGAALRDVGLAQARATALEAEAVTTAGLRLPELERKSGVAASDAHEQLVRDTIAKVELDLRMQLREREQALEESSPAVARSVMQAAVERYDGTAHLDRGQSSVTMEESRAFSALADPDGRVRAAFVEEVGCDLVLDEAQLAASVRGDDPLAREIARRVLRQLSSSAELTPDKIHSLARQTKVEVEREVQNAGRKAVRLLDLGKVHPDVLQLVGRLRFRLSYSQNQWRHSIEVAHLSALLAAELGLDVAVARRGGLLHDIGKAMTHDHEGSHALLGAEVARRCGEDEIVINAIASHHNDEAPRSAIAHVVTAADALSGGRPGARRESVTQYLNRIHDIQRIAGRAPAVKRVDIMQAGREVRVVVAGVEHGTIDPSDRHGGPSVADSDLGPLAQEIARRIEREITYAGQIKVTVIRESRAVSVAH
jgi:ribonuclease Y